MPKLVRSDIVFEYEKTSQVNDFVEAYPDMLQVAAENRFNRNVRPHMLSELGHEPPPAKLPWPFVSEKSRRWYFANKVPKPEKGQKRVPGRYKRTHKLANGWTIRIIHNDNAIAISTANKTNYEIWTTGKRQQPGHQQTGWMLSKKTIDFWVVAAREEIPKAADDVVKRGIF